MGQHDHHHHIGNKNAVVRGGKKLDKDLVLFFEKLAEKHAVFELAQAKALWDNALDGNKITVRTSHQTGSTTAWSRGIRGTSRAGMCEGGLVIAHWQAAHRAMCTYPTSRGCMARRQRVHTSTPPYADRTRLHLCTIGVHQRHEMERGSRSLGGQHNITRVWNFGGGVGFAGQVPTGRPPITTLL